MDGEGTLTKVTVEPRWLAEERRDTLLAQVREMDGFAGRFNRFARMGQTPVSAGVNWVYERVRARTVMDSDEDRALLLEIMTAFRDEVAQDGGRLVFVAMPPGRGGLGLAPWAGDVYAERLQEWRDAGFTVVDGREALASSDTALWDLYALDGSHLTAEGNRTLAEAVNRELERLPAS